MICMASQSLSISTAFLVLCEMHMLEINLHEN